MTNVTISNAELRRLQRSRDKLNALEAGGVDNWEWYDESLKEYRKELAEEELIANLCDTLNDYLCEADVDFPAGREAGPSVQLPDDQAEEFIKLVIEGYKELGN